MGHFFDKLYSEAKDVFYPRLHAASAFGHFTFLSGPWGPRCEIREKLETPA